VVVVFYSRGQGGGLLRQPGCELYVGLCNDFLLFIPGFGFVWRAGCSIRRWGLMTHTLHVSKRENINCAKS
jgi:hypothetical protein